MAYTGPNVIYRDKIYGRVTFDDGTTHYFDRDYRHRYTDDSGIVSEGTNKNMDWRNTRATNSEFFYHDGNHPQISKRTLRAVIDLETSLRGQL